MSEEAECESNCDSCDKPCAFVEEHEVHECLEGHEIEAPAESEAESDSEGCDRSCHYCRNDCVNEEDPHRIHRCEIHAN